MKKKKSSFFVQGRGETSRLKKDEDYNNIWEIFLYTVTILNASPLTTRIIFAFFPGHLSHEKNHESKYSHLPYRNLPYKNLPKAKSAFHIPHQIKIKVSIYITRDQTVAP